MEYKISAYYDNDLNETRYCLSTSDYKMDVLDKPTGTELLDLILAATGGELEVNLTPEVVKELYNEG